jgi:hypothetical protein
MDVEKRGQEIRDTLAKLKAESKRNAHKFVWGCKGYLRVNRYGETVREPSEVLGATEKEARETLIEGIERLLDSYPFRSHAYVPTPLYPTNSLRFPAHNWWY